MYIQQGVLDSVTWLTCGFVVVTAALAAKMRACWVTLHAHSCREPTPLCFCYFYKVVSGQDLWNPTTSIQKMLAPHCSKASGIKPVSFCSSRWWIVFSSLILLLYSLENQNVSAGPPSSSPVEFFFFFKCANRECKKKDRQQEVKKKRATENVNTQGRGGTERSVGEGRGGERRGRQGRGGEDRRRG